MGVYIISVLTSAAPQHIIVDVPTMDNITFLEQPAQHFLSNPTPLPIFTFIYVHKSHSLKGYSVHLTIYYLMWSPACEESRMDSWKINQQMTNWEQSLAMHKEKEETYGFWSSRRGWEDSHSCVHFWNIGKSSCLWFFTSASFQSFQLLHSLLILECLSIWDQFRKTKQIASTLPT